MARCSPTLATALEDWLIVRSAGRGLSPNTVRAYRTDVAAVAAELAGPGSEGDDRPSAERVTVDQLTPDAVVRALAALQRAGTIAGDTRSHTRHPGTVVRTPCSPRAAQRRPARRCGPRATEAREIPPPLRGARHRDRSSPDRRGHVRPDRAPAVAGARSRPRRGAGRDRRAGERGARRPHP
jgi:hypothetical protein